jgi:hypothetical protein
VAVAVGSGLALVLLVVVASYLIALSAAPSQPAMADAVPPRPAPAAEKPPVVSAPPPTRLRVTTQPAGARVKVDGMDVGTAPLEVSLRGRGLIVAESPGHEKASQAYDAARDTGPVQLTLRPKPAVITMKVDPPDAAVLVRDGQASVTRAEEGKRITVASPDPTRRLTVRVSRDGYRPVEKVLTARPGEAVSIDVALEPLPRPFARTGEKVRDTSCFTVGSDESETVTFIARSDKASLQADLNLGGTSRVTGPAPNSLWHIADGGLKWKGQNFRAGEFYHAGEDAVLRLVEDGSYAAWGRFKTEASACKAKEDSGEALRKIPPSEWVRVLLPAKGSDGWHRVRWGAADADAGWARGEFQEVEFWKSAPVGSPGGDARPADSRRDVHVTRLESGRGKLAELLKAEVAAAKGRKLKPYAELEAAWCRPSRALQNSMGDPRMKEAFQGTYIVRLDVDAWRRELGEGGFTGNAIPAFFELNDEGRPTGRKIDGGAWGANTPANTAPPLRKFFQDAKDAPGTRARGPDVRPRLEGTWEIIDVGYGNNNSIRLEDVTPTMRFRSAKDADGGTCSIHGVSDSPGGRAYLNMVGLPANGLFTLDPGSEPLAIDITDGRGRKVYGIAKFLSPDRLMICFSTRARPREFDSNKEPPGGFRRVITLSRKP